MIVDKVFNYQEHFGLTIIIENFLLVLKHANESTVGEFLKLIQESKQDDFVVKMNKELTNSLANNNNERETLLKSVSISHFKDKKTVFEQEHIARVYYYLPLFERELAPEIATSILSFHTQVLTKIYSFQIKKEDEQHLNKIRFFIRMVECLMSYHDETGRVLSNREFYEYLFSSDFSNQTSKYDNSNNSYLIQLMDQTLTVKTHILVITENVLQLLKKERNSFVDFLENESTSKREIKHSSDWKDTTNSNALLLEMDTGSEKFISSVKKNNYPGSEQPNCKDEILEEEFRKREYLRIIDDMHGANSARKQKKRAQAISTRIEKNKALLPALFNSVGNLSGFLNYILDQGEHAKAEQLYYINTFVFSIILGITLEQTWEQLSDIEDPSIVEIEIDLHYYAKFLAFDNDMGIKPGRTIRYKLPFILQHLRAWLLNNKPEKLDKKILHKTIRSYKNSYNATFTLGWVKIWKTALVHRHLLDPSSDVEMLLATQNIDQNASPRIAYTLAPSNLPDYSTWLSKYVSILEVEGSLEVILFGHVISKQKKSTVIFKQDDYVGSKKLIVTKKAQLFFKHLKTAIQLSKGREMFNLISIYVRYAATFLFGTRDFGKSADMSTISYIENIFLIHEKSMTTDGGYRMIPVCGVMHDLLVNYFKMLSEYGHKEKKIVMQTEKGDFVECTLSKINDFFANHDDFLGSYEIKKEQSSIALNAGRHLFTTAMQRSGLSLDDLRAFMGHASSGTELLSIFSAHKTSEYFSSVQLSLDGLAFEYGIEDLKDVI